MGFYFCGRYIHTDGDKKEVEQDMYVGLLYFWGSYDHYGYESGKTILKLSSVILF